MFTPDGIKARKLESAIMSQLVIEKLRRKGSVIVETHPAVDTRINRLMSDPFAIDDGSAETERLKLSAMRQRIQDACCAKIATVQMDDIDRELHFATIEGMAMACKAPQHYAQCALYAEAVVVSRTTGTPMPSKMDPNPGAVKRKGKPRADDAQFEDDDMVP